MGRYAVASHTCLRPGPAPPGSRDLSRWGGLPPRPGSGGPGSTRAGRVRPPAPTLPPRGSVQEPRPRPPPCAERRKARCGGPRRTWGRTVLLFSRDQAACTSRRSGQRSSDPRSPTKPPDAGRGRSRAASRGRRWAGSAAKPHPGSAPSGAPRPRHAAAPPAPARPHTGPLLAPRILAPRPLCAQLHSASRSRPARPAPRLPSRRAARP